MGKYSISQSLQPYPIKINLIGADLPPAPERSSMTYKLIIDGRLADLNDYLKAERQTYRKGNFFTTNGNELKKDTQEVIIWAIRQQLRGVHINNPIVLGYSFYEPNKKRDLDNVSAFAHKVIQDSLVLAGIIDNDGWKNIKAYTDKFYCDKENPRIEVLLIEVGD